MKAFVHFVGVRFAEKRKGVNHLSDVLMLNVHRDSRRGLLYSGSYSPSDEHTSLTLFVLA
jgi:hypothetical protein